MSVSSNLLCSFELLKPLDSSALKSHIKKGRNARQSMLNSPVRATIHSYAQEYMLTVSSLACHRFSTKLLSFSRTAGLHCRPEAAKPKHMCNSPYMICLWTYTKRSRSIALPLSCGALSLQPLVAQQPWTWRRMAVFYAAANKRCITRAFGLGLLARRLHLLRSREGIGRHQRRARLMFVISAFEDDLMHWRRLG